MKYMAAMFLAGCFVTIVGYLAERLIRAVRKPGAEGEEDSDGE